MLAADEIATRLREVRERIAQAAKRSGRTPEAIRLVLASKTQSPDAVRSSYHAGARDFGENYIREAAAKRAELADLTDATWHLIGHLQSNKTRLATRTFENIQTLDSARLADAIAHAQPTPLMPVLIEVNLGGEPTKSGVGVSDVASLIDAARAKVEIIGLMTIPPHAESATGARNYFAKLRRLRERLAATTGLALSELSMGMTEDFEVAIEEGATMVRVGRAVFGERPK
jgi:pyridoxal phosphate enzyme (YggS family)